MQNFAIRAEQLGVDDLWVTENTVDPNFCFDPVVALTYAAAATTRIRLGIAVALLPMHHPIHIAHQVASLDYISGGRAILGVGTGRDRHYEAFGIPSTRRIGRFAEGIEALRRLWSDASAEFDGNFYQLHQVSLSIHPVQPRLPIWLGSDHPNGVRRAAKLGDGWIGSGGGGGGLTVFKQNVQILKDSLDEAGRDVDSFPISKRLFIAVGDSPKMARALLEPWFAVVYGDPELVDTHGVYGTPEQVREQVEEVIAQGANHIVLNPVGDYIEQLEALAQIVALS